MRRTVGGAPGIITLTALGALLVLGACSSTGPVAMPAPGAGDAASHEQRLQALEAGLAELTRRMEALQAATGAAQGATQANAGATTGPAGYRPIRPGIVLASHPVRRTPAAAPAVAPVVAPAVPLPEAVPAPPPEPPPLRQGDWVINLASYTSRGYAERKLEEFTAGGVAAEQVSAQVNGATVYRLRVPGFVSSQAASVQATRIREQLGLSDTWVARR